VAADVDTPAPADAALAASKKARAEKVDGVVVGVGVANAASFVLLMGAGVATAIVLPPIALLGAALPVIGVPLTVIATAAVLAPDGEKLKTIGATVAGHYGGLVLGTLGGALVGTAGALGYLATQGGIGADVAGIPVAIVVIPSVAALGGLVGAGVGGTVGSSGGAFWALGSE
jgi:hypothetical protein